jgi:ketosteroid isomerase-like protein
MYHAIVKMQLRRAFGDLNQGNFDTVLKGMAPRFEHQFFGRHPLGGVRHTSTGYRLWFQRLARIFPDLRFELRNIIVNGWPWDTVAAVEWIDHLTTKDGVSHENVGMQFIRMRWTRIVEIRTYCDNQKLAEVCERQARGGLAEATADVIND